MSEKFLLKDQLFNPETLRQLATEIKTSYPDFETENFAKDVLKAFPDLELKTRMTHIAEQLKIYLPERYEEAVEIILNALPEPLDETKSDDDFGEFIYASYGEFVARFGCEAKYLQISLNALGEITQRFSAEMAIRPFINHFPEETLEVLHACAVSGNYHERRLASECLRPKLPWAEKLHFDYSEAIPVLDKLYDDKTRFVTRSVANHLNDISKIDPAVVIETLQRWQASGLQEEKEMDWVTRHALRTLVKQGHSEALTLLGYGQAIDLTVGALALASDTVTVGEALVFACELKAEEPLKLLVDYVIHFRTKSDRLSPKVFKIKKYDIKKGETLLVSKSHPLKVMTTKKLYAGEHKVELQINGKVMASKTFVLRYP